MKKCAMEEFSALRAEINSRLSMRIAIYALVFVSTSAVWMAFFEYSLPDKNDEIILLPELLLLLAMVLILIIYKMSEHNDEQIMTIATYIFVFFEWPSRKNKESALIHWETLNFKTHLYTSKRVVSRGIISALYLFLALVNISIHFFMFVVPGANEDGLINFRTIIILVIMLIVLVAITIGAIRSTKYFDVSYRQEMFLSIADEACACGVISLEEKEEILNEVFPKRNGLLNP